MGRIGGQSGEDVGEPGLRVDVNSRSERIE
ncbi:hypothetical protein X756_31150 [Mesorhizobium sp. LSHC412B00]|nr:hypothetical protein X756_31150 [Mesorhizobium sp. LSHC412B00]